MFRSISRIRRLGLNHRHTCMNVSTMEWPTQNFHFKQKTQNFVTVKLRMWSISRLYEIGLPLVTIYIFVDMTIYQSDIFNINLK